MILLDPRTWLVALVALGLALGGGYFKGAQSVRAQWRAADLADDKIAKAKTETLTESARMLRKAKDREIDTIRITAARNLERLRNRPTRMPPTAAAQCTGATGAELSRPDAEFLVGEAARADRLQAALSECYAREDIAAKVMASQ